MKISILLFIVVTIMVLPKWVFLQQFGPEITVATNLELSLPAIDIDSQGNIGIIWGVDGYPDDSVKFVKSYDGGVSFENARIVDILPYDPDAGYPTTPLLVFDSFDNPMVFYVLWVFPFYYFHYYKKSPDGGNSFPQQKYSFLSRDDLIDFLYLNSDTTLLAYSYYANPKIMVKRSADGGLSYFDSTFVYTGNSSPQRDISLARSGNGDVYCFYTLLLTQNSKIFYNRSSDSGNTFTNNIQLDSIYQYQGGGITKTYQNYLFVISAVNGDTITPKIIFYKSEDFGQTFLSPKIIFDYGNVILNTFSEPTMIFNPNVGICLLWNEYVGLNDKTWFSYSDDFGETFHQPVLVTEGDQWVTDKAMAVSDSGDVYITYLNNTTKSIVLRKAKLPVLTTTNSNQSTIPRDIILLNNYPNPFNSSTQISFKLPKKIKLKLEIFDISGKRIRTLVDSILNQGDYHTNWDGLDSKGKGVSSGVYICSLKAGNVTKSIKLLYIK